MRVHTFFLILRTVLRSADALAHPEKKTSLKLREGAPLSVVPRNYEPIPRDTLTFGEAIERFCHRIVKLVMISLIVVLAIIVIAMIIAAWNHAL